MNDNELIESLISADLGKAESVKEERSSEEEKSTNSRAVTLKLSDYSSESLESSSCIPNYRLADCCCNCAFSTFNPVTQKAHCSKWDCCVIPVYYCDSHTSPSSFLPPEEQESLSEPNTQDNTLDLQLYSEAVDSCPHFELKEATSIYIKQKYKQLYKLKHGSLEGCNID